MKSSNYCFLLTKIILFVGRFFGLTFGGVQIKIVESHVRKPFFTVSLNKKWKFFGKLILIIYFVFFLFQLYLNVARLKSDSFDTIVDIIYIVGRTIYVTHCFALYVITYKYGFDIFEFLSHQSITFKQFRICIFVSVLPTTYVLIVNLMDLIEHGFVLEVSIWKRALKQFVMLGFGLPWAFGTSLLLILSLVGYWSIRKLYSTLSNSTKLDSNNLNQICKQFLGLKYSFQKLDSILAFLNVTNFSMDISFILMDIPLILNKRITAGLAEFIFNLGTLVLLCWVHGLPHKACRNLIHAFDIFVAKTPPFGSFQKINIIFSRNSVGFKLLGNNYELSLLSSVSVFLYTCVV